MQPRTLDAILAELNTVYEPQIQNIRAQQSIIPQQTEADIASARAAQSQAYENILSGARQRGLAFSGIPLSEQAKYASSVFAPAVLAAQQRGREQALGLEQAILGIQEKRGTLAQQLRQQEQQQAEQVRQYNADLAERQRQFDLQRELSSRATGGGGGGGMISGYMPTTNLPVSQTPTPTAMQRTDKGFDFTDVGGAPISAAKYAQLTGSSIGQVLYQMGASGDTYAQQLYNQLKNDPFFGKGNAQYDARIKQAYSPIFWGT